MAGSVEVKGTIYGGLMPEFASLSDDEIAAALNYVLTEYNAAELPKDFALITPYEVSAARTAKISATRMPDERKTLMDELRKSHDTAGSAQ